MVKNFIGPSCEKTHTNNAQFEHFYINGFDSYLQWLEKQQIQR